MVMEFFLGGAVAVALLIYLGIAFARPEDF
jgi:K+-transporting ATPase KdpF subunit